MIVLRAIGAFFARIWRWIKETAWVQPLLIVGIIFGVIFSIPSIVKGIQSWNDALNSSDTYYHGFQKSLVAGNKSDADKITELIYNKSSNPSIQSEYGDKFFLLFVSESCDVCKKSKPGFQTLQNHFGDTLQPKDKKEFKMYTIFADEVTSDTTTKQTAFVKYMDRRSYFFEDAAAAGYNSAYYLNGKISDSDLQNVESVDPDNFLTPTIMLIDFTESSPSYGVSEIMFGVEGDNDYEKAQHLLDCWDHKGDFEIK